MICAAAFFDLLSVDSPTLRSGFEVDRFASLLRRVFGERLEKLLAAARVAPLAVDETVVKTARFRGDPDLAHRRLRGGGGLRANSEIPGLHAAAALAIACGPGGVPAPLCGG